jgi:hypothetical protein
VALVSRELVEPCGLGLVLRHASAVGIEQAEVIPGIRGALVSREPHGLSLVLGSAKLSQGSHG